MKQYILFLSFLAILFVISLTVTIWNFKRPLAPIKIEQEKDVFSSTESELGSPASQQWRSLYSHPLAITS